MNWSFCGVEKTFLQIAYAFFLCSMVRSIQADEITEEECQILPDTLIDNRNFINNKLWPNGIVYFEIDPILTTEEMSLVLASMAHISSRTKCIHFVPRPKGISDYVFITTGSTGCYAYLGYIKGLGKHILHLQRAINNRSCMFSSVIIHEILHTLGFAHEQTRPDRDDFVRINWNNIREPQIFNFVRLKDPYNDTDLPICTTETLDFDNCVNGLTAENYGLPYDYESIMHYGAYAFSKNGNATIEVLDPSFTGEIGRQPLLSDLDVEKLNTAYSCSTPDAICEDATNLCSLQNCHIPVVRSLCQRTCLICECQNRVEDCSDFLEFCNDPIIKYNYCAKSCGACVPS